MVIAVSHRELKNSITTVKMNVQCLVQAFCLLLRSILSEKGVVRIKYARATFSSPISLAQKHPFQMPLFLYHGKCLYTYVLSQSLHA